MGVGVTVASAGPYAVHSHLDPDRGRLTTPAPHHSIFHRPDALPDAQPAVSKHRRPDIIAYIFLAN